MIQAWPYGTFRSKAILRAAQCILPVTVLLYVAIASRPSSFVYLIEHSLGPMLVLVACQICFYLSGVDELILNASPVIFLARTLKAHGVALALTVPLFYTFPQLSPGYGKALLVAVLSAIALPALRPILPLLIRREQIANGLLIVGGGELAGKLRQELVSGKANFAIGGFARSIGSKLDKSIRAGLKIDYCELIGLLRKDGVSRIVVAEQNVKGREELVRTLLECKLRGVAVERAGDFYERLYHKIWLEVVRPEWFIFADGFRITRLYLMMKRFVDILGTLLLIILTAPLLVVIAAAVKLSSPGPVLFRQERVSQHGKTFTLYKFRSMRQDAERDTGPVWAGENDQRVTPIGRILRKSRLDEIPQAFNILRGELSFVGPRPERPCFVDLLRQRIPYYELRHYVKPGLTGWAQVNYGYAASVEDTCEKLQYDLYYVKHVSLCLDLAIILKTTKMVLLGRGR